MKDIKIEKIFLVLIFASLFIGYGVNFPKPIYSSEEQVLSRVERETIVETTSQVIIENSTTEIFSETSNEKETLRPFKSVKKEKKVSNNFGAFKSYTDYKCLSRSSAQWKLQEQAYTDENGLRKIGNAYLVALGSYYGTELGTKYIVTLENGNTFEIILCDCKKDVHTDETNRYTISNGCVIEFYVETEKMPKKVRQMGNIGAIEFFSGNIRSIEKTA